MALSALSNNPMERPMLQSNDLSRSFTALNQDRTLIVVIEMCQLSSPVAGMVPGVDRQPLKKLKPDEDQLLKREAHLVRRGGRQPRPLCRLPDGRGRHLPIRNPAAGLGAAAATGCLIDVRRLIVLHSIKNQGRGASG